jgi:hypothetical protein
MGLRNALDALLGKTVLPKSTLEHLFAISTARITLQASLDLNPSHSAGLCFKPVESSQYEATKKEIEDLLQLSAKETGSTYRLETDEYHFTWVILEDPDFEDLVTTVHLVSQTLIDRGLGGYLLCAIFRFEDTQPVYWIYNFKMGRYYPFVPGANKTRDTAREFRLRSIMEKELPLEQDVERWYPLWGIPF